tara:strand:- start:301 stop:1008 length:708 start_codon:yes stop_codon:yes gene_type:complete
MTKIICVSGDSFTQEYLQKPEDRWSTQIGATHNIAMGGAGNERIFNSTVKFLNENTPDTLIIGWSSTARGSLYHKEGRRIIVAPHRCFDEETGEDYNDIKKFYYSNLHNDYISFTNALNYMIFIQEYCKSKNIKLLYFRSVMDETLDTDSLMKLSNKAFIKRTDPDIEKMGIKHNYEKLQKLIGKLDKNIWINEFWYSMRDHIEKNFPGQIKAGYTHALPVEAVKDWCNLVKKQL